MPSSSGVSSSAVEKSWASAIFMRTTSREVLAADAHVERLLPESRALAFGAERITAVAAEEHAHVHLVLLAFQVIEEAADEVVEGVALAGAQVAVRHVEADRFALACFLKLAQPGAILRLVPRIHGAVLDRERLVRDDAVHVVIDGVAEALAARARAQRELKLNRIGSGVANSGRTSCTETSR